jgi:two-component system, LytTR family, response regulator
MTLRVLIVDDEAVARRRGRRLLQGEPDVQVVGECGDGRGAIDEIVRRRPDLVLLDVQMPELDGFEVVQRVPASALPAVIFVTAFDRYALRAFDVHAIDYLLKPFTRERFRLALDRARDRIHRRSHDAGMAALVEQLRARPRYLSRLSVRSRGRVILLPVDAIDWVEAADNYVTLHAGGRQHLLRETLATLERRLNPDRFVRIHRSTLVQIDRILELHPASHGDVEVRLRDGTRLALSRTWRDRVERTLGRT